MGSKKQRAHQLLEQLDASQLDAIVLLLQVMIGPVAFADAPLEEEELTPEAIKALDQAREWLKDNPGIPHEQVLAELGITKDDIDRCKKAR